MLVIMLSAVFMQNVAAIATFDSVSARAWREDIAYLAKRIPEVHPNPFHAITRTGFADSVRAFSARIPRLNNDERVTGLLALVALLQDGHNGVAYPCGTTGPTNYPFRFRLDSAGIFVERASPSVSQWVGSRLVSIDGHPAAESWARILPVISHDQSNVGKAGTRLSMYLTCASILHGLGLTRERDRARFVFMRNGTLKDTVVAPIPTDWWSLYGSAPADWADARDIAHPPLWLSHTDLAYWSTYLQDRRALYVQVNEVQEGYQSEHNLPKEGIANFWEGIRAFIDTANVERLVIDLRRNLGGNNYLLKPIIVDVVRASKVDRPGHLFVLVGPATFSAGQNLVNRLQLYAEVVIAGEPTGENVNFYSDADDIVLPHTHMRVAISSVLWQDFDQRDTRRATAPQLAAPMTFEDYVHGRDPALDLVLSIEHLPAIEDSLRTGLRAGGFDAALAAYRRFVAMPMNRYTPAESTTNAFGYAILRNKNFDDAIAIFRVNATTNPQSWNAWDSLGDAYTRAGRTDDAIQSYREALRLNPRSESTREALARLTSRTRQ